MAPKKTTTKKETTKRPREEEPEPEKKKFRVQCKAGLLTYNEVSLGTREDLVEMYNELKEKFSADIVWSLCLEEESRLHVHVFFECETVIDCDLQYFQTKKSGPVGDFKANRGKNLARGHWYVQCEYKKSHKCFYCDKVVKPNAKWIVDEWRNNKIEKITEALAAEKLLTPQLI